MKKIAMMFVVMFIVTGLTASAIAYGPGWQNGYRHDNYGRYQRTHYQFDNGHRQAYHHQNVRYVPVHPVRPVVHVPVPARPGVAISLPNFSMWIH